ncbi:adenosine deaminase [Longilinea arvoryzae]|uniref:Adenosine deaminase n=1 Tax=Longilinea arvoryzae TaxID=360412 RepID=A0A0S7B6Y8_9CHLR|nr:adenosine deaminase [Longilinea arvoryzae]GAP12734.1 adenosine deaminase [Longilinea arvoryzae]
MHYTQTHHSTLPSSDLIALLSAMPKVELHVHLEGATSPQALFAMAARNRVELPVATVAEWKAFYEFKDFDHFIQVYRLSVGCMQSPRDFTEMVVDFMGRQARQNIRYSEVFLSAALHIHRLPPDEILAALREGAQIGRQQYGVEIAFIPDMSRQEWRTEHLREDVLEFALQAKALGIGIGLGLAGFEVGYPSSLFRDVFAEARRQGLHVVAHAGETGDAAFMRDVLETLRPERIGHAIRALEDPELVEDLRERRTPLEVSPQSNYCTRVVDRNQPHPIRGMVDAGLNCTLNSDDPAMFSTDLNNEYLTLAGQGFSFDELWQLNLNGLRAAFLPEDRRAAMLREWEAWRQNARSGDI